MDPETIIEIEDLYVNFYTKSGIVYALDGVNLKINRGEAMGLVGESGCGKSVTANSILRLVPSPPGKIEKGHILFNMPPGVKMKKERVDEKIKNMDDDHPEAIRLRHEIKEELEEYDIVRKPEDDLRKVRGKAISMIFQEPMSSLNPVFTAGYQISEAILLHERAELATAVLERIERQKSALNDYNHVKKVDKGGRDLHCSNCNTQVDYNAEYCPQCNGSFAVKLMPSASRIKLDAYGKLYKRMKANPNDRMLRVMSRIPLVRRYEKPMKYEANERAVNMLRLVRVPDPVNVSTSYPYELSGGMQQRVMIAMALACKPQLLIADEPTTALDVTIQAQIIKLMRELQKDTGTTILMITHNLGIIAEICDRVGVMYAGNIVELSSKRELFKEPLHPYTLGLLAAIPRIDTDLPRLETIEGNVPNLAKPPTGCRFHPRCPYSMGICTQEKPRMTEITPGHSVACHLYTEVAN
ncbi:MAG: ATP-binding cassette domain-containing protein [Methanomassiliicoccus sp.]|nr:ATP-binding cassette domain-containing protein [Methanomassiliicoccus sp.]